MKSRRDEIYTAVEIGTHSIKIMLGEFLHDEHLSILAYHEQPSLKMCKAEALDTRVVGEQVALALNGAEQAAGFPIEGPVFMAISGAFIETVKISAKLEIEDPSGLIREEDLAEATRRANDYEVPSGKLLLTQSVNRLFRLADGRILFNPVGQCSRFLEVEIQHFLADKERANTTYCLLAEALGKLEVSTVIYTPLALSAAVFPPGSSDEALDLVIDLGAGMCSLAIPTSAGYFYLGQISIGCEHIANDLAIALELPIQTARALLVQMADLHCNALATRDKRARMVDIRPERQNKLRRIPASSIELVVETRLRELFELIRRQLTDNGAYSWLGNRVYLSGGGARIPQVCDLAATVFNRPVSIAQPYDVTNRIGMPLQPQHNTVIGLLKAGRRDLLVAREVARQKSLLGNTLEWWKNAWQTITDW
ncbi:MAG: hypothetical protein GX946_09755 [Oligosphaeraceae bacterium]|nr:hypothetical protein [Oligosphaeraceae bacterium]